MKKNHFVLGVGLLAVLVLASGCATRVGRYPLSPEEEKLVALVDRDIPLPPLKVGDKTVRAPLSEEEKEVFRNIYFAFDRYEIVPEARLTLEKVARYLNKNSVIDIIIEGHCCDIGTEEYNMALGERRALAVRRYLVTLGVTGARITTVSFGEEQPADPRPVEEARRLNRRAEFKIVVE